MKRTLALLLIRSLLFELFTIMNNFYDDEDIFSALGLKEEWEDEETADVYAEEDARILKEYGF